MVDDTQDSRESLRSAICAVAQDAVLVRIYSKRRAVTHVFEHNYCRALIGWENEMAIAHMVCQNFGSAIDWRWTYDFHLPTGRLYLSPEPTQLGYVPEESRGRLDIRHGSFAPDTNSRGEN